VVRQVTARLEANQKPASEDEYKLVGVYRSLESYLCTEEPLRAFTQAELRQMVTREFGLDQSAAGRLWQT
jgi:hypothetical protein